MRGWALVRGPEHFAAQSFGSRNRPTTQRGYGVTVSSSPLRAQGKNRLEGPPIGPAAWPRLHGIGFTITLLELGRYQSRDVLLPGPP